MPRKAFTAEQIINKLREAELILNQGTTVPDACRKIGVTDQTYYRWRKEYGGLNVDQAKRLKDLEKENVQLKRLVADLSLDKAILKEASRFSLLYRKTLSHGVAVFGGKVKYG